MLKPAAQFKDVSTHSRISQIVHKLISICKHASIRIYICMYVRIYIYYTHVCIHTYTGVHTQTHAQTQTEPHSQPKCDKTHTYTRIHTYTHALAPIMPRSICSRSMLSDILTTFHAILISSAVSVFANECGKYFFGMCATASGQPRSEEDFEPMVILSAASMCMSLRLTCMCASMYPISMSVVE